MKRAAVDNNTISRIYHQLDRIEETLERISPELVAIKVDLKYHIQRTTLLEETLEIHKKALTRLTGFFSIGGWLVGIVATVLTILSQLGIFG